MKVYLDDVVEAIEFENEDLAHFYNKKTGIIIYKENSDTATYSHKDIENIDSYEEWQKELILSLYDLQLNPQDYIKLPSYDVLDEYKMMRKFYREKVKSENEKVKDLKALKRILEDRGLLALWYDFREQEERKIAIKWCNDNNIDYK